MPRTIRVVPEPAEGPTRNLLPFAFSAGSGRELAPEELRSGRPRRPPLRPLPLPESGGGHVLRSQSLPALPGGVPSQFCPTCHPERSEGSRHARPDRASQAPTDEVGFRNRKSPKTVTESRFCDSVTVNARFLFPITALRFPGAVACAGVNYSSSASLPSSWR